MDKNGKEEEEESNGSQFSFSFSDRDNKKVDIAQMPSVQHLPAPVPAQLSPPKDSRSKKEKKKDGSDTSGKEQSDSQRDLGLPIGRNLRKVSFEKHNYDDDEVGDKSIQTRNRRTPKNFVASAELVGKENMFDIVKNMGRTDQSEKRRNDEAMSFPLLGYPAASPMSPNPNTSQRRKNNIQQQGYPCTSQTAPARSPLTVQKSPSQSMLVPKLRTKPNRVTESKRRRKVISPLDYYHGFVCREDLISVLTKYGDFCIRVSVHASENRKGKDKTLTVARTPAHNKDTTVMANRDFVIAVNCNKKNATLSVDNTKETKDNLTHVRHIKNMVLRRNDSKLSIEPGKMFRTLNELITHYRTNTGVYKGHEFQLLNPVGLSHWEWRHKEIELQEKKLGEGAFGEVRVGTIKVKENGVSKTVQVAVKMLKNAESVTRDQVQELMHEGRVMRYLDHKNVLKTYGIAVLHEPLYLMSELCGCGALREYLRENAKTLTLTDRLNFCLGSARGVEYLHTQRLIHRDLAVRNVLLTEDRTPKVSDFGLAKVTERYEMKEACKIPVRYLAPETLDTFVFTPKSDVFSFGMVMWEIFENGVQPHDGKNAQTIKDLTKRQQFLKLNDMAPEPLRKFVSEKIFVSDPENRCNMSAVVQAIEKITTDGSAASCNTPTNQAAQSPCVAAPMK